VLNVGEAVLILRHEANVILRERRANPSARTITRTLPKNPWPPPERTTATRTGAAAAPFGRIE